MLMWQSKNLLLQLRKLKFQPQRQRKNKLQLLIKLLLQRLKVKRMVLQKTALMLRWKAPRTNQLPLT